MMRATCRFIWWLSAFSMHCKSCNGRSCSAAHIDTREGKSLHAPTLVSTQTQRKDKKVYTRIPLDERAAALLTTAVHKHADGLFICAHPCALPIHQFQVSSAKRCRHMPSGTHRPQSLKDQLSGSRLEPDCEVSAEKRCCQRGPVTYSRHRAQRQTARWRTGGKPARPCHLVKAQSS